MRSAALAALMIAACPAMSAEKSAEVYIPFANSGGIRDWRALDEKGLYVQGPKRQWYYATLIGPCYGLPWAHSIGFVTNPADSFDKFSAVLVQNHRCPVTSLVKTDSPDQKK